MQNIIGKNSKHHNDPARWVIVITKRLAKGRIGNIERKFIPLALSPASTEDASFDELRQAKRLGVRMFGFSSSKRWPKFAKKLPKKINVPYDYCVARAIRHTLFLGNLHAGNQLRSHCLDSLRSRSK